MLKLMKPELLHSYENKFDLPGEGTSSAHEVVLDPEEHSKYDLDFFIFGAGTEKAGIISPDLSKPFGTSDAPAL